MDGRVHEQDQRDRIQLYLYNEMSEAEREELESELQGSAELRRILNEEERFLKAIDERGSVEVPETLLAECRQDLMRAVYREERRRQEATPFLPAWAQRFLPSRNAWVPAAAAALLVMGFFSGRMTQELFTGEDAPAVATSVTPALPARTVSTGSEPQSILDVDSVAFDPMGGGVEIVIEERRTIRGSAEDPRIRGLLLSSIRSPEAGMRLESVEALRGRGDDVEIQRTLIQALVGDENPGVRLKALEALAPYHQEAAVRSALIQAVKTDPNVGVRVQAIDLLTQSPDRRLAGVLQELVTDEQNPYVRLRSQQMLHEMNASVDLY